MNRVHPEEEILAEYASAVISHEDRVWVEKHISNCAKCRKLVSEAHSILTREEKLKEKKNFFRLIRKNAWGILSVLFLMMSFLFSRYFLQLLLASSLLGLKWITDSKSVKTLITIHKAQKHGEEETPKSTSFFSKNKN